MVRASQVFGALCLSTLVVGCIRENPGFSGPGTDTGDSASTATSETDDPSTTLTAGSDSESGFTTEAPTTETTTTVTTADPTDMSSSSSDPTTTESDSDSDSDTTIGETTEGDTSESESESDSDNGDQDMDGLPDECDPFPEQGDRPGALALPDVVYAVANKKLYRLLVSGQPQFYGSDTFIDDEAEAVLDVRELAVDECGVLLAATVSSVYACNPTSARCWYINTINEEPQGFTVVPGVFFDEPGEAIVVGANEGNWYSMDIWADPYMWGEPHDMLNNYVMSGDLAFMPNVGLFATVNPGSLNYGLPDSILRLELNGNDEVEYENLSQMVPRLRGLAAISPSLYAINDDGRVIKLTYSNDNLLVSDQNFFQFEGSDFVGAASRAM